MSKLPKELLREKCEVTKFHIVDTDKKIAKEIYRLLVINVILMIIDNHLF